MKYLSLFIVLLILVGCKSTKTISDTEFDAISTKKLITRIKQNEFEFKTLAARLRVRYQDEKKSQSVTVSLRMEKDNTIWLSASVLGISVAKAMVTPTRVSYYEKISQTYFDGDFSLLSSYLGVTMNYNQLQRLLLGQTVNELDTSKYRISVTPSAYQLAPKNQNPAIDFFFLFNPSTFLLAEQRVVQMQENIALQAVYLNYQMIDEQSFPENIVIQVQEDTEKTQIEIEYRSVSHNTAVRFPFEIPRGYKELRL